MKWAFLVIVAFALAIGPAAAAVALAMAANRPASASPQSFEGVVSDSMCGKKHMVAGKTDAECTSTCVKANSQYALVAGDKIYTLAGAQGELQKLAGRRVRVTGDVNGKTIAVNSVAEVASH